MQTVHTMTAVGLWSYTERNQMRTSQRDTKKEPVVTNAYMTASADSEVSHRMRSGVRREKAASAFFTGGSAEWSQ